jgi:hypothetical protein
VQGHKKSVMTKSGCKITKFTFCPKCRSLFSTSFNSKNPNRAKKFCSQMCANSRVHTDKTKNSISLSIKKYRIENEEEINKQMQNSHRPKWFSSQAELSLLKELGDTFNSQYVVNKDSKRIIVDIASKDKRI